MRRLDHIANVSPRNFFNWTSHC